MDDWGFNGPDIEEIEAVHYTYGHGNVFFENEAAAERARKLTGWKYFDQNALEMRFCDHLLEITNPEQGHCFFGDWEFQTRTPEGKDV